MSRFIDIHAHTNFNVFSNDRDAVIRRALDNDTWVINVGTQQDTSRLAVQIAEQYDRGVYAIIGLHPVHTNKSYHDEQELGEGNKEFTSRGEIFDTAFYTDLAKSDKVVGIGECGLDYYRADPESKEKQEKAFRTQIELALLLDVPVMLHVRDAYDDVLKILDDYPNARGDVHFFAGDVETAKRFLDKGFYLSFTGVITFAKEYEEVVKFVPLDRIITETDCPYVAPAPYRGKRNEPVYVQEVTKKVAEIKKLPAEEVQQQIFENARQLFGLPEAV